MDEQITISQRRALMRVDYTSATGATVTGEFTLDDQNEPTQIQASVTFADGGQFCQFFRDGNQNISITGDVGRAADVIAAVDAAVAAVVAEMGSEAGGSE